MGEEYIDSITTNVSALAERVCMHLKEGYQIKLCMENGAAWVELVNPHGGFPTLPDTSDKELIEQINDALCVANGWDLTAA